MPKYTTEFIRKVSEANDIVDIISQYVPLKQNGNDYVACCPFHSEKTPSFHVNPEKQLYHCFGCGAGGDVYKFLMEKENFNFNEAVKFLATNAGIALPNSYEQKEFQEQEEKRNRLFKINESAANFYYRNLIHNQDALDYLHNRGVENRQIKTFGLGLAPAEWTTVTNYLLKCGFTLDDILNTGLAIKNRQGTSQYDRFRNRITYPIQNVMNRVIGFGARKISDEEPGPKYLNTPETELFKKGYELYNLNRAKATLRDNPLILVEGYMDVIALDKYGVKNAAAALGTSFTKGHAKLISRYTRDVILCFDGDSAGEKATLRTIDVLDDKSNDLDIKIVRLPPEHDPDSFIREYGTQVFMAMVQDALPVIDFKLSLLERDNNLNNSSGVFSYVRQSLDLIKPLPAIERDYYAQVISKKSGIAQESIKSQLPLDRLTNSPMKPVSSSVSQKRQTIEKELEEAQISYLLFCYEDPSITKEINSEILTNSFFRWIHKKLSFLYESRPNLLATMTDEERAKYENQLVRLLMKESQNFDKNDFQKLEKSIGKIEKYNRRNTIRRLSSNENLLTAGDEQKKNLLSNIIELKKVDFQNGEKEKKSS